MYARETKQANSKHVDSTAFILAASVVSTPPPMLLACESKLFM